MVRIGQCADLVEPFLVPDGHAVVLAEMIGPRGDDELLDDPAGVGGVSPDPPLACSGAAAAEAGVLELGHKIFVGTLA
jgi:hypothetical protein